MFTRLRHRWQGWRDARIDRRFGLDTGGVIPLASLGATGTRYQGAHDYEPVTPGMFDAMVAAAAIEPREFTFVDYGSGKGRALVLAAERGFRRVIGVELVPALHAAALANIEAFRRRRPGAPPIEARLGDATAFVPPPEDALLYFYNPFSELLLRRALRAIEKAWRREPALRWHIAYRNPVHARVFDAAPFLHRTARHAAYALYRLADATGRTSSPSP